MKLAIVNESWKGGAGRCAGDLLTHLRSAHEVLYYPRVPWKETAESLLSSLEEEGPDLVHCHSFYGDFPYRTLARLARRWPTCLTVHDPRPIGTMEIACWECDRARTCYRCPLVRSRIRRWIPLHRFHRERLYKRLVHRVSRGRLTVIAPSRWLFERLGRTELARERLRHVPYGVDLDLFRPGAGSKAAVGVPEEAPTILHVAQSAPGWRRSRRKGLNHVADAFVTSVLPRFPEALLLVVGEGLVPNHPQVRPMGYVVPEELPRYYAAADVFVLASLADNLPFTILEAMACGRACVGSDVGGIPEMIEDGVTGRVVPSGESEELGEAFVQLLSDDDLRADMGARSRARVEERYSMSRFLEAHEELYRVVAGSAGANAS